MTNGPLFFGSKLLGQLAEDVGLHLCDVGSRGGALEDFLPAAQFTRVTGFEPDHEECERLNQVAAQQPLTWKQEKHYQVALGDRNARQSLIVCNDRQFSSTLEPVKQLPVDFGREECFRVVDRLDMDVEGLDSFCVRQGIEDLDFLKVDVQGGELAILKGGHEMVSKHLLGIRCEVEFSHLYVGQPLFSEMELHLRESGFYPADWLYQRYWRNSPKHEHGQYSKRADIPYSRGRLIHSDVLFLRDHHWIIANLPNADDKICRLLLIAILYRHIDLAAALLDVIKDQKIIRSVTKERWLLELGIVSRHLGKQDFLSSLKDRLRLVYRTIGS